MGTFIAALGIETVSKETAKLLVGAGYDSVPSIASAGIEDEQEMLDTIHHHLQGTCGGYPVD